MKVLRVFFLGLIYGWFMRWIIDEIYMKDNLRMITNENTLLKDRIRSLEMSKSIAAKAVQRTEPMPQRAEPAPTPQPVQRASASSKDNLKLIKGIGPQMEKKLNLAGVNTFEQMSRLTTADLQMILGISKRATQSADNLLTQAKRFAQQDSKH